MLEQAGPAAQREQSLLRSSFSSEIPISAVIDFIGVIMYERVMARPMRRVASRSAMRSADAVRGASP